MQVLLGRVNNTAWTLQGNCPSTVVHRFQEIVRFMYIYMYTYICIGINRERVICINACTECVRRYANMLFKNVKRNCNASFLHCK